MNNYKHMRHCGGHYKVWPPTVIMNAIMGRFRFTHRRFNNFLTIVVLIFGVYLMAAPFLPQIMWWLNPPTVAAQPTKPTPGKPLPPIPDENLLIIPRLGMREVIHDGPTMAELRKGVWLVPNTSQPDKQSNTVIIGHRFTYAGPAIFYFLDKVQTGDVITIDWHHKEYTYKVSAISVVLPTDVAVQNPTPKPQLTLYTCTPLWSVSHRLVVTAPLQGVRS